MHRAGALSQYREDCHDYCLHWGQGEPGLGDEVVVVGPKKSLQLYHSESNMHGSRDAAPNVEQSQSRKNS